MPNRHTGLVATFSMLVGFFVLFLMPFAAAQSSQVAEEWSLFNQILIIGIAVGIVVFGIMFYAIIRYRERPEQQGAK